MNANIRLNEEIDSMQAMITGKAEVRSSTIHGVGVFAIHALEKDEIIEQCYCLPITEANASLQDFVFQVEGKRLLALGLGSIYNHSATPNAVVKFSEDGRVMFVVALHAIASSDEIVIDYGAAWFETRERDVHTVSSTKKWLRFIGKLVAAILLLGFVVFLAHEVDRVTKIHPFHAPLPLNVKSQRGT